MIVNLKGFKLINLNKWRKDFNLSAQFKRLKDFFFLAGNEKEFGELE